MNNNIFRSIKSIDGRILALIVFLFTFGRLIPEALTLPQHGDEKIYAYLGGYYLQRLSHLDFSGPDLNSYADPGFAPASFYSLDHPFGSNFYYVVVYAITGIEAPTAPYAYDNITNGPETAIPERSLPVLRIAAVLAAAVGLALITLRLSLKGAAACLVFLFMPYVAEDMARAWSESLLLLGFGLCVISYGTKWFPVAAAAAGAFKLNGMAAWLLLLLPTAGSAPQAGKKLRRVLFNIWTTLLVWSFFTPASWTVAGPLYIAFMWKFRLGVFAYQSTIFPIFFGLFIPTRYLWPIELALLVLVFHLPEVLVWIRSNLKLLPLPVRFLKRELLR
jgi:hypothetical protein